MVFSVNFLDEEWVRTLPPGFPLPSLGFLFSELKCLTCHFPAVHWMGYALSSARHRALGSNLCLPTGDVVPGRGEISQNTECSSWPGLLVPTCPSWSQPEIEPSWRPDLSRVSSLGFVARIG